MAEHSMRIAGDGELYTFSDFQAYYLEAAEDMWQRATHVNATERDLPPPSTHVVDMQAAKFMRRLAEIREEVRATSSDHATERVELDKDEVSLCYQRFGRILLTDDLLPHQKQDKRYRLRNDFEGDTYLSTFQRSFTDNMLRKFLGHKSVAFLIWQHGLPSIADRPLVYHRRVDSKVLDMGMLQSGLDECLQWYISVSYTHLMLPTNREV